jgi:hypothetical protein
MLYLPALIVAGVLVACAVAVLALSEKAEATFPGKNGKIVYVFHGGGGGIYTTNNPGGGGRTKITEKGLSSPTSRITVPPRRNTERKEAR